TRRHPPMSKLFASLGCVICLAAASPHARAADDAATRFHAIYTREWSWRQEQFQGLDDEDSQGAPSDHLPRVDASTQAMRERYWSDVLEKLDAIKPAELHGEDAVDYAVYHDQIETLLADQHFRTWEMPFNSDSGFWSDLGFTARATYARKPTTCGWAWRAASANRRSSCRGVRNRSAKWPMHRASRIFSTHRS